LEDGALSWVITPSFYGYIADADAKGYLARVHAAESQTLEPAVALAIEAFVVGCKADGIWSAIKASCILAGARTLTGALVPLVGTAPTNFNFVAGDYNRKTGLVGDASTKYLSSGRLSDADPQDNCHLTVFAATAGSAATGYIGGSTNFGKRINSDSVRLNSGTTSFSITPAASSLVGVSRSSGASYLVRNNNTSVTATAASSASGSVSMAVFAVNNNGTIQVPTNARFAFYSIGESLDLALLDTRVTTLINAFAAAIP
jgi:hypothetical protein